LYSFSGLFWLLLAGLTVAHWWQSRHVKALALNHAARRCRDLELQLLDQSVALRRIRPARGAGGLLQWRRTYDFEFSSTGQERARGSLVMLGNQLESMHVEAHVVPGHTVPGEEYRPH
jgi:hypothetical protein